MIVCSKTVKKFNELLEQSQKEKSDVIVVFADNKMLRFRDWELDELKEILEYSIES